MIELNKIESQYLNLIENAISIEEFENWAYSSKWLESGNILTIEKTLTKNQEFGGKNTGIARFKRYRQ